MIHQGLGRLVRVDGEDRVVTRTGQWGCVLYGPYARLAPGRYTVEFDVRLRHPVLFDPVCCRLEVATRDGHILAARRYRRSELSAGNQPIGLPFDMDREDVVEFRAFATGWAPLSIRCKRPLRPSVPADFDFSPILPAGAVSTNSFLTTHFTALKGFHAGGFRFEVSGEAIVASSGGIRFAVEHAEDLQLMGEIFVGNAYNLVTGRDMLALDIGMNVGLASLFLAGKPQVREVHAFEPFAAPRERAQRNFALNPELAPKITAYPFGLSDRDRTMEVGLGGAGTIGVSVRGTPGGPPGSIALRNAADIVAPFARRAAAEGLDLVVKMDCEGSEFPIFDALQERGLLPAITAMVIEWHKWWSPDKTQADLIGPLTDAGFAVFDRTNPGDPHAGLLSAVRMQ